jgi:AGZA family xanthine/uracil permease-like MFS transporter
MRLPAVVVSVLAGLAAYAIARAVGYEPPPLQPGTPAGTLALPWPTLAFVDGLSTAWHYVPLAIPVAIATVIGGIDNTESASAAGDTYSTRSILLVEGAATFIAAVCGGVIQNTPYIGHPAYKEMGSRAGYTLATGLFIGVGAATGVIGALIGWLPESVVVPVLIFVGLEMAEQAMVTTAPKHIKAVALALIPVMANLVNIEQGSLIAAARIDIAALPDSVQRGLTVFAMLGNGFIVTAMLWSAWLIFVIDHRLRVAAAIAASAAALTLFGLMHSPYADARLFLPWQAGVPSLVFALATGYALLALLCAALSLRTPAREAAKNG